MTAALILTALLQTGVSAPDTTGSSTSFEMELDGLYDTEDVTDAASIVELLEDAAQWQVPVNTASAEALRGLPGLSERELQLILSYRTANGRIEGPEDLLVAGLSKETTALLVPFLSFAEQRSASELPVRVDIIQRWTRRLDVGRGYANGASRYLGGADAFQSRVKARVGPHVSAGIILDNDAGEPLVWSPSRGRFGADFTSLHLGVDGVGPLERFVAGGFSMQFGEGIVLGHGTSGISALRVASVERLLRTHTSAREHAYFRGLAVQSRPVLGTTFAAFVSSQALDGRTDSLEGGWRLVGPGHHRTETEVSGRRLVRSRVGGVVVSVRRGSGRFGALAVRTLNGLDHSFQAATSVSLFGGWTRPKWALTTEVLPDLAHASATASFSPALDANLIVRARRTSIGSPRPHTRIGVNSRGTSIEMYEWETECRFRPLASSSVTVRVRERHTADAQLLSRSSRYANVLIEYRPRAWFILQMRGYARTSDEVAVCRTGLHTIRCSERRARRSLRIQAEYRHSASLRSRSRIEIVRGAVNGRTQRDGEAVGFLMYEDLRWRVGRFLQIDARFAVFETSDTSTRVYSFENDVLYGFSAPSFAGRGRRWYVLAHATPSPQLSVQLKIGSTTYEDVTSVGTGLDEVSGNRIREMKLQMRWKWGR